MTAKANFTAFMNRHEDDIEVGVSTCERNGLCGRLSLASVIPQ